MVLKTVELGCGVAVDLIKLIIALRFKARGEFPTARSISNLLFLVLYTDDKGALTPPKFFLPAKFTIRPKGPYIPVESLLRKCGAVDVAKAGATCYFVRGNVDTVIREVTESLNSKGLSRLVKKTRRVVDIYGRLDDEELSRRVFEVLGLDKKTKTLFFNVSLDSFIRFREALKTVYTSGVYRNEEELLPDLWD